MGSKVALAWVPASQVTLSVVFPSALSWILASLHASFGFALAGAVVGEFLGARHGIGLLISTAQGTFNAAGVFSAMIVLAVVALGAEYLLCRQENPRCSGAGIVSSHDHCNLLLRRNPATTDTITTDWQVACSVAPS